MSRLPSLLWFMLSIAFVLAFVFALQRLPETFATHFGINGEANGWSSRSGFALAFSVLFIFTQGLIFGISRRIESMPGAINWPNKEYWLSTDETRARFFPRVRNVLACAGAFVSFVFLMCLQIIAHEARLKTGLDMSTNTAVAIVLTVASVFVVSLLSYSRRK